MINPRVTSLSKSATLKITAATKKLVTEGKDVVNFAAGEPDFDTPDFVKKEAQLALNEGFTKYTPSAGYPQLKERIAAKLREENHIPCDPSNIIVTAGAKYALYATIVGLTEPGDEIIVPSPYWVSYPPMITLAGGTMKVLPTTQEEGFKISPQSLRSAISPKTKFLILNYPANPTGVTYTAHELKELYAVIKEANIFVVSDEIYEKLIYDGRTHTSFASFPDAFERTIAVNGMSKAFSMTGWRIGYLAGPECVVSEVSKIIGHTTSCACSLAQRGAFAALGKRSWPDQIRDQFQARRDLLWKGLSECSALEPLKPQGTFYLFCGIKQTGLSSFDFASRLLQEQLVSCIPADSFGAEGFVRMSFSTSQEQIAKGVERIKKFLKK